MSKLPTARAAGVPIRVTHSPGGVETWLVEDHTLPMLVLRFAFRGGSAQDPMAESGLATFMAGLLDEGAGPYDAQGFHEKLDDHAIELSFSTGSDASHGSVRTLTRYRDEAAEMARLALIEPRFDTDAVERVRGQMTARLKRESTDPNDMASRLWVETAFPGHAYSRQSHGSIEGVAAIARAGIVAAHGRLLARDNLVVSAAGDIDEAALGRFVDQIFGALPATAGLMPVPFMAPTGLGQTKVVHLDVPQCVVVFGRPGIPRLDADYIPAVLVNHVLGGGVFQSRLFKEVREKRGLAYSVHSQLAPAAHSAMFHGSTSTKNDRVQESITVIREQIQSIVADGPTPEELDKAKKYLTGSYPLSFDSSSKIAGEINNLRIFGLPPTYTAERNGLIEAVSREDTQRVARRLLGEGELLVAIAGQPSGI